MFSAQGIFFFLLATGRIQRGTKDSDHSEKLSISKHGSNQRALCYKQFLMLNKINNKDIYVDYDTTEDISEDGYS